jgi:hypothetical protein
MVFVLSHLNCGMAIVATEMMVVVVPELRLDELVIMVRILVVIQSKMTSLTLQTFSGSISTER